MVQEAMEAQVQEAGQADAQEEEELMGPIPIDALQNQGINAGDLKKLAEGGIYTVEALAYSSKKELVAIKGLSEAKVVKMQAEAAKLVPMGFTMASVVAEQRGEIIMISTGCKELDSILEGVFLAPPFEGPFRYTQSPSLFAAAELLAHKEILSQ